MKSRFASPHRGSALLITLAFILLVSFLVVAFLTRSQGDLSASANYSSSVQADEVAQTGSDFLIGGLQKEIREATATTGPSATVFPARTVKADASNGGDASNTDGSKPVNETNPREFLPFRTSSAHSQSEYSGIIDSAYGSISGKVPPNVGSTIKTSTASAGGRPFDNTRWNAPKLLPYTPSSGFNWVNCPTWIYVTRSGPMSPDAPSPYRASIVEMRDLTKANTKAAVGRFAYVMYDISGLLDANVSAVADAAFVASPKFGEKGSSAFASLQRVMEAAGTGGDSAAFASWRQPAPVGFYGSIVGDNDKQGLIEKGNLTAPDGSNLFFTRQDLSTLR